MQSLHNAMIGIGYALIVLFFAISLFKNTANFHELKRPEAAVHYLIRFVAAKALVGYGMDIMLNIFPSATALFPIWLPVWAASHRQWSHFPVRCSLPLKMSAS